MRYKNYKFRETYASIIPSTTYSTHGIHAYTAKFIPHIPRFFIEKYSKEGDFILDPFAGSGTTLLEANIAGRNALGIDISPLARLISKVKTTPIPPSELDSAIQKIRGLLKNKIKRDYDVEFYNKEYWFHKKSIKELKKIMGAIDLLSSKKEINKNIRDFFRVCFSSIVRKSSFADPANPKTYCSPKMKIKKKKGIRSYPIKYFIESIEKNAENIKELYYLSRKENNVKTLFIGTNDATNIKLPKGLKAVDLIITSPPYSNAQDYFRNIKLELFWLKEADKKSLIELGKKQIGGENHASLHYNTLHTVGISRIDSIIKEIYNINKKSAYIVYKYFYNMERNIQECKKVLKKNGHCIFVVGNNWVRGIKIPIHKVLIKMALRNGFKLEEEGFDIIPSRKFMIKRNNSAPLIDRDWVIDLKRV